MHPSVRPASIPIPVNCPDLRRTHAHPQQGTCPSEKMTNTKDVKRYLKKASIAKDGFLVVRKTTSLSRLTESIIVPRSVLDGLVTALNIKFGHPSKHHLQLVIKRSFYALDMQNAITRVSDLCHTCASLPGGVRHETT